MLQSDRNYCARIDVALYAHRGQWVSLPRGAWQCISNCPSCKVLYHLIKAEAGPEPLIVTSTVAPVVRRFPVGKKASSLKYFLFAEIAAS
jgi:hypothetical protein